MTETQQALGTDEAVDDLRAAQPALEGDMWQIGEGRATEQDLEAAERRLRALEDVAERARERVKAAGAQEARKAAERVLEAYVAAALAHNEAVDEAAGVFLPQPDLPRGYAVDVGGDGHSIVVGSESIRRVRPMVEVRDMGLGVLGRHLRGGYVSLGDDAY